MPGALQTLTNAFHFAFLSGAHVPPTRNGRWRRLSESTILVLGSPRSGTTWLAKIFDSHPDILYRHEPDQLTQATAGLDPPRQVAQWLRQRRPRASAKRPSFRKSWRPASFETFRTVLAAGLAAAQRVPMISLLARRVAVPDMIAPNRWESVRGMVKLVNWDAGLAARTMPNTRCVFILRHPCGQIASVLAGLSSRQLIHDAGRSEARRDIESGAAWAERHGTDAAAFDALPDVAKYAWSWRAFNEPAAAALRDLPNARIVIYEDLCRQPDATARSLFAFAGLDWNTTTATFLGASTRHTRATGYYDVFRSSNMVVDRWRQTMRAQDQDAVRDILATSPLARHWPDLTPSHA